jgi:hypothetical protein
MFHDESNKFAHRSKSRVPHSAKTRASKLYSTGTKQAPVQVVGTAPATLTNITLSQPLDDLGMNFFKSTYVGGDPAVSQLHYLPKLCGKAGSANSGLQQTIVATDLVDYANTTHRLDGRDTATKSYAIVIRSINGAISDLSTAVQGVTLLSINMAVVFEALIIPSLSDTKFCSTHLNGAIVVGSMILTQKKETDLTQRVPNTLIEVVITDSWVSHSLLPSCFIELKGRLGQKFALRTLQSGFLDQVLGLV